MNDTDRELLLSEFNTNLNEVVKLSFPVRDRELQLEVANSSAEYLETLGARLEAVREGNAPDLSNFVLGLFNYMKAAIRLLHMWLAIRSDDPDEGWNALVDAQAFARQAMRAHDILLDQIEDFNRHLLHLEKTLFPPQQFVSMSFTVEESKCSICDDAFHECDHITGLPYNGQFCTQVVTKAGPMEHTAIVTHPFDKGCRLTSYSEDGFDVDTMTLVKTPSEDGDKSSRRFKAIGIRGI